jgi:hypothetical protein
VLRADEFIHETIGFGLRLVGDELEARRHAGLGAAVGGWELRGQIARGPAHGRGVRAHLAEQVRHDAVALLHERHQQVLGLDLRVVGLPRELDGAGDRFACFFGVLVDVHTSDLRVES